MYRMKPSKWLVWAPAMAGLPFLAAVFVSSPDLRHDLEKRTQAALEESELKVEITGRDAVLQGEINSQADVDSALRVVRDIYGVRRVDSKVVVVPPVELAPPELSQLTVSQAQPVLKGTWPEDAAKTLSVTLGGKTYELGKDQEISTKSGNWELKPASPLVDGSYDVKVAVTDGKKAKAEAEFPAALVIDTQPPEQAKLVLPGSGAKWPFAITGTWPEEDARQLKITLNDRVYVLGKDQELSSDGKGRFSFTPKQDLSPGTYDLKIESADALGNIQSQIVKGAIVIPAPAPPTPPPAPEPPKTAEPAQQSQKSTIVEQPKVAEETPAEAKPAPPAEELPKPTVNAIIETAIPPVITGTWPEGKAATLSVKLNDNIYQLGKDSELTSDGKGNWRLTPSIALSPGKYVIMPEVSDRDGRLVSADKSSPLEIAAPAPPAPPPKPVLLAPTVTSQTALQKPVTLSGTWDVGNTQSITVKVGDTVYSRGAPSPLDAKPDGTWSLALPDLADGTYDVTVTEIGNTGQSVSDASTNELSVETQLPDTPTVDPMRSAEKATQITGTFDQARTVSMMVKIPSIGFVAADRAIARTGNAWSVAMPEALKPGTYDIVVDTTDKHGRTRSDNSKDELAITPPPQPVAAATPVPPADCRKEFAELAELSPVRYEFGQAEIAGDNARTLDKYAELLKAPACATLHVEIRGYTDFRGKIPYNWRLSQSRANQAMAELIKRGIDPSRLRIKAFSEFQPLDSSRSDEARTKNRRVEFRLQEQE